MSELEAGPALDALVAERVLGKTLSLCDGAVHQGRLSCGEYGHVVSHTEDGISRSWWAHLPPYSTSIGSAWRVIEHLIMQGWEPQIHYATDPPGPHWEAWLWQFEGEHPHVVTREEHNYNAETAPLAICRAALLAVTEEA